MILCRVSMLYQWNRHFRAKDDREIKSFGQVSGGSSLLLLNAQGNVTLYDPRSDCKDITNLVEGVSGR